MEAEGSLVYILFYVFDIAAQAEQKMEIFDDGDTKAKAGGIPQGLLLEFGARFRFCSAFSIEKVWSLPIIWKTIRTSKLTLVIAFALLLFPVL